MDANKLTELAFTFDALLTVVNGEIQFTRSSRGIEYLAFLYTLDENEIPRVYVPIAFDKEKVSQAVRQLRNLFLLYKYWYLDGKLVKAEAWKLLYNVKAMEWGTAAAN